MRAGPPVALPRRAHAPLSPSNTCPQVADAGSTSPTAATAAQSKAPAARAESALNRLQRLLNRPRDLVRLRIPLAIKLSKELLRGWVAGKTEAPSQFLADGALAALARAAELAPNPAYRGQLLADRAKLLQLVGAAKQANEEAEAATRELSAALAAWQARAAQPDAPLVDTQHTETAEPSQLTEAAEQEVVEGGGEVPVTQESAYAALSTLLDITSLFRSLGREERANSVLGGAAVSATHLGSAPAWLRAMSQLTALTGALAGGLGAGGRRRGPAGRAVGCRGSCMLPNRPAGLLHSMS